MSRQSHCIVDLVILQAVCAGEGNWGDGSQTHRALLRRHSIQRTPSLQVSRFPPVLLICACTCEYGSVHLISVLALWQREADQHYSGLGGLTS